MCDTGSPIVATVLNQPAHRYIFWILGFGSLWVGLKFFDDEVLLIVAIAVGSVLVLAGLLTAPPQVQIIVEVVLIIAVFHLCMECIERGNAA
jgi:hypothetical protein